MVTPHKPNRKPDPRYDRAYYKLSCRHIRTIDTSILKIILNVTSVYCKKCDGYAVVVDSADRFRDM